jgi:hypothetical protein
MPENELVIEGNLEVILEGIQVAHCNTFDIPLVPDMCRSDLTNAVVSESFHVPVTCINSAFVHNLFNLFIHFLRRAVVP